MVRAKFRRRGDLVPGTRAARACHAAETRRGGRLQPACERRWPRASGWEHSPQRSATPCFVRALAVWHQDPGRPFCPAAITGAAARAHLLALDAIALAAPGTCWSEVSP